MPGVKKLQAEGLTSKSLLAAIKASDDIVIYDGDTPVARVTPVRVELEKKSAYFVHYPHEASECLHTCWRHDEAAQAAAEAERAQAEPETVPA